MENILGFDAGPALVDKANGVTRWRLNLGIINITYFLLVITKERLLRVSHLDWLEAAWEAARVAGETSRQVHHLDFKQMSGASPDF